MSDCSNITLWKKKAIFHWNNLGFLLKINWHIFLDLLLDLFTSFHVSILLLLLHFFDYYHMSEIWWYESHCWKIYCLFYIGLKDRIERSGRREREKSCIPLSLLNACNNQDWIRPIPAARNTMQVSYTGGRGPSISAIIFCLLGCISMKLDEKWKPRFEWALWYGTRASWGAA